MTPKDAYYFPHDSNAHDDPKVILLIEQLGLEGFGIYWLLIEILRGEQEYQYPLALLPALARRYNTSKEKIQTVINSFHLFEVDGDYFYSPALLRRMERVEVLREQNRKAGIASGEARRLLSGAKKVEPPTNNNKSTYGEFGNVKLTGEEWDKLVAKFGTKETVVKIEALSQYMKSKKKRYNDHYATILSWDRKDKRDGKPQRVSTEYTRPEDVE